MYHHILALLVLVTFAGARNIDNRILGGEDTTIEQHPFQVSLQTEERTHICGAALIKPDYALTAAHCSTAITVGPVYIMAGSTNYRKDGKVVRVQRHENHPQFQFQTLDNDVCVITLVRPFKMEAAISTISLVPLSEKPRIGEMMTVAGWGFTDFKDFSRRNQVLKVIRIPVVDSKYCSTFFTHYKVTDRMFCAGGSKETLKAPYKGDSGGPAINDKKQLAGIVSWGKNGDVTGIPAVFTDVSHPEIWKFVTETAK